MKNDFNMVGNNKKRLFEMMYKVGGMPLNEIDWEKSFPDVHKKCMNPEELKEYLNMLLDRQGMKAWKRPKLNPNIPHVHASAIPKIDPNKSNDLSIDKGYREDFGDIDINKFINDMTKEPIQLIDQNSKMEKSATETSITFNTGLPAFKGLVFDEDEKKFYNVTTCTGAGTCVPTCYARHHNYIQYPAPFLRLTQILNLLLNNPEKYEEKLMAEVRALFKSNAKGGETIYIRWNDSGDFFAKKYFQIASDVTRKLKEEGFNVKSYAHTKVADVYNSGDPNILFNFSTDANEIERAKVDLSKAKTSEFVSKEIFKNLFVKSGADFARDENKRLIFIDKENGFNELKQIISKNFGVDVNTLIGYKKLLETPIVNGVTWNAIVMPGDGDVAAQRPDVRRSFLLEH